MSQPPDTSQTLTDNDSPFDPSQAAALLEQATLMIIGFVGAVTAAALRDRPLVGVMLAVGLVGAVAGFGDPVGSWLVMGIGLCVARLVIAASIARWQRGGVVGP